MDAHKDMGSLCLEGYSKQTHQNAATILKSLHAKEMLVDIDLNYYHRRWNKEGR